MAPSVNAPLFPTLKNWFALDFPIKGKIVGQSHWEEIIYHGDGDIGGFLDKSTVDKSGNGTSYIYANKPCDDHYAIAMAVLLTTPFYVVGTIVYNAIRIIPVICYLAGRIFYDYFKQPQFDGVRFQSFGSIAWNHTKLMGYQTWFSISNIVRTPFYLLGFLFGVIYGLIDPLNGRKVAAAFERGWNHNIERHRSFWSVQGAKKDFLFEGGGDPEKIGQHAFYLPGCYQANAVAVFEGGLLTQVKSISGNSSYSKKKYKEVNVNRCHIIPLGCKV